MFNPMDMLKMFGGGNMGGNGNNLMAQMMGQMMNGGGSPQQMMNQMAGSNPIMKRAMEMSEGKTPEQLKDVCKNLCEQRGINFDDAFNQFQTQFKGK